MAAKIVTIILGWLDFVGDNWLSRHQPADSVDADTDDDDFIHDDDNDNVDADENDILLFCFQTPHPTPVFCFVQRLN